MKDQGRSRLNGAVFAILLFLLNHVYQDALAQSRSTPSVTRSPDQDRRIAAQFAPIFKQGLGDEPRADYITNFDFDGDWRGNNNWKNLDDRLFPLLANIYFSVIETTTHYYVHYAVFHPRDYKSDLATAKLVDTLIRRGLGKLGKDPTGGLADEVALSHENDLEGCLVVAAKNGAQLARARVQYVETMAHNRYLRYRPAGKGVPDVEVVAMQGQHPVLFVEPRGHGVMRFVDRADFLREAVNGLLSYKFTGRAEDPDKLTIGETVKRAEIGYDLIPIFSTLWERAQAGTGATYGEAIVYQLLAPVLVQVPVGAPAPSDSPRVAGSEATNAPAPDEKKPLIGSAFLGEVGSANKARPPWGWFDRVERDRPAGEWFFDPATVIERHYKPKTGFATSYTYNPYIISRSAVRPF